MGNGEIATKFCNSKLSIPWSSDEERDEKFRITAKAPEGYTHYVDSRGFAGRIEEGGLDEINAHFEQAIQDGQIREIPEDGIIEMPFSYYPVEKVIVDNLGKEYGIYSINRLWEDLDESTHNVMQWFKLDSEGNVDKDSIKKEYIYSRRLDCNLTLPESVHDGPVPSIYNEELAKKYHLDIEFVPMGITDDESAGEDYYRIRLLDEYGEDVDIRSISENGIEIFFSYPKGITKAEKNHFKLNHFKNAAHVIDETLEFDKITYLDDGFVVTLTHFSPFLLTWEEQGDNPRPIYHGGSSSVKTAATAPAPKPAVTPVTRDAKGNQVMGTSIISKPANTLTETEKSFVRSTGYIWTKSYDGFFQLKNTKGEVVRNEWALVPDSLWTNPVGNLSWFYFDENGNMLTGWQYIKGADGKYRLYYFNEEGNELYGACLLGGTVGGRLLDREGHVMENGIIKEWAYKPE